MSNTQSPVTVQSQPQPEPQLKPQICIFLLQLGGPNTLDDIQAFLHNLFEDVLPLPRFLRRPLAGFIAKRRAPKVRPLYAEIGGGSPLLPNTEAQATALEARMAALGMPAKVLICMRYAPPRAETALAYAREHLADVPWVALSLYPQYSYATSRSSLREMETFLRAEEPQRLRAICAYPTHPRYITALVEIIEASLAPLSEAVRSQIHLVFSAHGLPMSLIREGDPYPQHIERTVAAVLAQLSRPPAAYTLCYQSRVGPVKWLEPSTLATLGRLGAEGCKHVAMVPVAFTSEHIETLHEIGIELREIAEKVGIETYLRVPTASIHPAFIDGLASLVLERLKESDRCCGLYAGCELRGKQAHDLARLKAVDHAPANGGALSAPG